MRVAAAIARFWWDFLVGDDWKIAATIGATLVVSALVVSLVADPGTWLAPVVAAALMVAFVVSLAVDLRHRARAAPPRR